MKKIKWGVIGAGGIADRRTIPGMMLAENAELVAVMEINMELAEKIRAKYGCKYAYDNYQELIDNPEVEAVYIASPVFAHVEPALAVAKAKKHLLCEKPIAFTVEETKNIINACKEAGVKYATGYMMRFGAYHMAIKKLIAEGGIGDVVSARAQLSGWFPESAKNWRQEKKLSGGGALVDMAVHCIDIIEYLTGATTTEVGAFVDTRTFTYNVDDSANVLLHLSNGAAAYVDAHFNVPDEAVKNRVEIYGTKGSVICEKTIGQIDEGHVEVYTSEDKGYDAQQNREDSEAKTLDVEFGNMYTREIESFSDSILNDTPVAIPMEVGLHIQQVTDAAYRSAENKTIEKVLD
ncbi:MAG: Gfo/Idh/MocA family oxidoreductase [Ruminococcaceae bacterium]|nr:Gfo/Idh/MocA family oxidoreductase [Oscillospiraceae bacterium]